MQLRIFYSYGRLFIASWLFMGGVALQFVPTAATVARDARLRERQMQAIPAEERAQWLDDRDIEDGRSQAYLRVFGVLMGGFGFAAALREAAYLSARYGH
jgi:hypothetical protein